VQIEFQGVVLPFFATLLGIPIIGRLLVLLVDISNEVPYWLLEILLGSLFRIMAEFLGRPSGLVHVVPFSKGTHLVSPPGCPVG